MVDGGREVEESRPVGCQGSGFGTELGHGLSDSGRSIQVPHAGLHAQLAQSPPTPPPPQQGQSNTV